MPATKDRVKSEQNVHARYASLREQPEALLSCLEHAVLRNYRIVISAITWGEPAPPRRLWQTPSASVSMSYSSGIKRGDAATEIRAVPGSRH